MEDLGVLKAFAQDKVRDICVNNPMLDVEMHGVLHLTCGGITKDDMPWNSSSTEAGFKIELETQRGAR
jgi:hypothetical protein